MTLSPQTWQFICEHQKDDVRLLALQAKKYPDTDMHAAIVQIAGRQAAAHKIPSWHATEGIIYPEHLSLEQCSSEITAGYKASVLQHERAPYETLADLTGGFGIDCAFLSAQFGKVTYIERQKELCDIARHNFAALHLHHITVENRDSADYLRSMSPADCIFMDPARRNEHGGKMVRVSDCEPNAEELENLLLDKAKKVMIKLSPMLDLSQALRSLPHTSEVHLVSVQNECKELLLILENRAAAQIPIHCVNLTNRGMQRFSFTREEESASECVYTDTVRSYLYEPNTSVLKAGAFKRMAATFGIEKLHPNSHLYTSDEFLPDFPGRKFRVNGTSLQTKELLKGIRQANITIRNYPVPAAGLRKQLKLAEGGDAFLFATTIMPARKVLIKCTGIRPDST